MNTFLLISNIGKYYLTLNRIISGCFFQSTPFLINLPAPHPPPPPPKRPNDFGFPGVLSGYIMGTLLATSMINLENKVHTGSTLDIACMNTISLRTHKYYWSSERWTSQKLSFLKVITLLVAKAKNIGIQAWGTTLKIELRESMTYIHIHRYTYACTYTYIPWKIWLGNSLSIVFPKRQHLSS